MLSFGTDTGPQSFCHSSIALPMLRCTKSAQKSTQVCPVATVLMETRQLVLANLKKKLFIVINGELNRVSVPKIISERCELVKLYHINCSGPVC